MRLIDADAVIRFIANIQHEDEDRLLTYDELKKIIRDAQTADAELVRHGFWEDQYYEVMRGETGKHIVASARCSVCKKYASQVRDWTGRVQYKNCPVCLARMDEC